MTKNIVIICHNYYPEETSTGLYTTQMAEYLSENGWEVNMITGFPHYPKWRIHEGYKRKRTFFTEKIKGVHVMRYKHFVPENPSFFNRVRQLVDFSIGSYINLLKLKKADLVLSVIPFTSSAWLGKRFSRKLNCRHWIQIQDFEFDAAKESGMLPDHGLGTSLLSRLYKTERKILNSADLVSTISQGMISKLKLRTNSKIYFFPNWLDENIINPASASKHPFFSKDKFSVLYSGNIGNKQDWDTFIQVAHKFNKKSSIEFIVVGEGASRKILQAKVGQMDHVIIHDQIPGKDLNDMLCSPDLHILFQKDNVVNTVMPSKLLGMMASEVPCLVTGNLDSEIAKMFAANNSGYYFGSDEIDKIADKISELSIQRNSGTSIGRKARQGVIDSYSKEKVLRKFIEKLNSLDED